MRRVSSTANAQRRRVSNEAHDAPPFPAQQMFVLACCRICEPIAFMSIFPYVSEMIKSFRIASNDGQVAFYAGMITSAFTLAEFSTGFLWGKLSDRIGRKPILLCGLIGTAISVLVFGFAPNFYTALVARALGGLLNGNIGVLQTTVAELVTVREHQPRAYTIMPMVWCIGSVLGPAIGGALANPCLTFPALFLRGTIWDTFPFLLPNLFSAAMVLFGVIIGLLFLDETHPDKKYQRDRFRDFGRRLAALFERGRSCSGSSAEQKSLLKHDHFVGYDGTYQDEYRSDSEEQLPCYRSHENSPRLDAQDDIESCRDSDVSSVDDLPANTIIFTKPVIFNIVSYGILAFHTMTFDQLFPVFLEMGPPETPVFELPFKFVVGLQYSTATVGVIIAVQGLYSLFSNFVLVAPATRYFGSLRLFRMLAFSYFTLYFVTPYIVILPAKLVMPAIYLLVIWKCTYATMAYPNNAILLANSAPSRKVLGTINGAAASTASLCRALGPLVSGVFYSIGLESGYSGLAWWVNGVVSIAGALLTLYITDSPLPSQLSGDGELIHDEEVVEGE